MARHRSRRPRPTLPVREPRKGPSRTWLPLIVIAGTGIAAYASSLNIPFIWEDTIAIANNRTIRALWPLPGPLAPPLETPMAGRPIPNLTLAINYALGGLDPVGYHWWNIALHLGCALLLYAIVHDTFGRWRGPRVAGDAAAAGISLTAALVWMLHPLQTEAVDYLTQRTESTMALCLLVVLYCAIRSRSSSRRAVWEGVAVLASALGMASKASMVVGPLIVILYDRMFEFDSLRQAVRERRRLYAGLAISWLVLAWLLWLAPRSTVGASSVAESWTYLLNQAELVARYLRLAIWPRGLVLDYGLPRPLELRDVLPQALAIVALIVVAVVACMRWPRAGFLAAVAFLALAPTSSVVPISSEVGAERRMYVPMMALAVLAVASAYLLLDAARRRLPRHARTLTMTAVALAAVVVAALGAATIERNRIFADGVRLWRGVVDTRPHGRARLSFAMALEEAGNRDEAIRQLQVAILDYGEARYALGTELYLAGRVDEAIDSLTQFVAAQPSSPSRLPARSLLGRAYATQKRLDAAEAQFRAILEALPGDLDARVSLGDLYLSQQRYDEAVDEYAVAAPQIAGATMPTKLGMALMGAKRFDEAAKSFETALARDPQSVVAHRRLAELAWQRRDAAAAVSHAEAAVKLAPSDGAAHNFLGMVLASTDRLSEAVGHFRSAAQLDPADREARANLEQAERLLAGGR